MGGIVMIKVIKRIVPFIMTAGMLLGITLVYAYYEDSVSVTNHIAIGDVNIGITEYEIKNGREVLYENHKTVFPGDEISKIPRIKNYANDCWVRVKMTYVNNLEGVEGVDEKHIIGMSEDWILRGEYFYYKNILRANETADIFQKLYIPEEWNEVHSKQQLSIEIQAEAIQAANFQPDFTAMSPWGNQEIELCVHEENGTLTCLKEHMDLYVEFNGKAHKLLAVPGDFFHNLKRVMPGEIYRDEIALLNTAEESVELFFHTEIENQKIEQLELLEQISLTISLDDKVLYEGNLLSKELDEDISIGIYESGEKGVMKFELRVPKELKNVYALRDANVKWIFSVFEKEMEKESNVLSSEYSEGKTAVQTGDDSPIIWFVSFMLISAGVMIGLWIKKKRRTDTDEK